MYEKAFDRNFLLVLAFQISLNVPRVSVNGIFWLISVVQIPKQLICCN